MLLQRVVCVHALCAAECRSVLHERCHAEVSHEQSHSCSLLFRGLHGIAVVVEHVVPVVVRLREVDVHVVVIGSYLVAVFALALCRPAVVAHYLRHSCSHAAGVGIAAELVVRLGLSPLALEQRCDGLGEESGACRSVCYDCSLLQCLVALLVAFEQQPDAGVGVERVEGVLRAVCEHFTHSVVAGYEHEAATVGSVEEMVG